ncbi:hypothetical protein [Streptomyces shenzhenensis]|uniref:hypothetical protein n=1 Tax=Streptomyces shenzhenensis TaxID=943815 RepID=UPI0015F06BD5|nr:hypothetical protein [Streptomyces shenzhenensis]
MYVRNLARAAVAVCAVGVVTVMVTVPASATGKASVYTNSVERGRVNYWTSTDDFRVSDTSCDGHSVYAQYQRAGAGTVRLNHSGGCGTHTDFNRSFTNGQTIKYRACVNLPAAPDICGPWKWDTTG